MFKQVNRYWKYLTARMARHFDEKADPRVQLEQALDDARDQHRRLKDQATTMIANQKQTEMQLNRALSELERVNQNARHAVLMAEQANIAGDMPKAASFTKAAEQFAERLITLEQEIENYKSLHYQVSAAAEQAKAAVAQNALSYQEKLRERQKLLSQLDQARLQEQMNEAIGTLSESVGDDMPSFDEVRSKIEARYAKAKGVAELASGSTADTTMLEIEAAARANETKARLNQIREQLGVASAPTAAIDPAASPTGGQATPAVTGSAPQAIGPAQPPSDGDSAVPSPSDGDSAALSSSDGDSAVPSPSDGDSAALSSSDGDSAVQQTGDVDDPSGRSAAS